MFVYIFEWYIDMFNSLFLDTEKVKYFSLLSKQQQLLYSLLLLYVSMLVHLLQILFLGQKHGVILVLNLMDLPVIVQLLQQLHSLLRGPN